MDDDLRIPPVRPSLEPRTKRKDRQPPDGRSGDLAIDHDRKHHGRQDKDRDSGGETAHPSDDACDERTEGGIIDILA